MEDIQLTLSEVVHVDNAYKDLPSRDKLNPIGNLPDQIPYSKADLSGKLKYYKFTPMSDSEVIANWNNITNGLKEGTFTEEQLYKLLQCVMNVRGVSKDISPFMAKGNTTVLPNETYDNNPIGGKTTGASLHMVITPSSSSSASADIESESNKARGITFLACLYCRLIVKDTTHIRLALPSLRKGFGSLYGTQSAVLTNFNPLDNWAEVIKTGFSTYPAAQGTLALICAYADETISRSAPDYGLARFLLLQHLEFTGMHLYKMTMMLVKVMAPVSIGQFLSWVSNPHSRQATLEIATIVKTYDQKDVTYDPIWKYAKLVESLYFLNIAASRNKYLTCLLAKLMNANGLKGTSEYANPENIRVVKDLPNEIKTRAQMDCNLIMKMYDIISTQDAGASGLAWMKTRGIKRKHDAPPTHQSPETQRVPTITTGGGEDIPMVDTEEAKRQRLAERLGKKSRS